MKVCSKCKIEKKEKDFFRDKYAKDGLSYYCKICDYKKASKWRKKNLKEVAAYKRKYRKEHPEIEKAIYKRQI